MTQFCQISPSVGRESDDQANNEDEDEDNEALGDGTADHEVVPAHVGRPLRLHVLLHFLRLESLVAGGRREAGASCRQSAACHTLGRLPTDIGSRVPAAAMLHDDDVTIRPEQKYTDCKHLFNVSASGVAIFTSRW